MNRYDVDKQGEQIEREDGPFALYEEARVIEVDRDIEAANLQQLVEKVLDFADAVQASSDWHDTDDSVHLSVCAREDLVNLARSLKQ